LLGGAGVKLKVFAPLLKVSLERFRRIKIDGAQLGGGIQATSA
jgi:hypothetical protein